MAMPLHDEQLFAKYAFARLRDIENSQQRAQLATMEKEAAIGRVAKWLLGAAGAGAAGYVGRKAYDQYQRSKKQFRPEDTSSWGTPTEFWNAAPTGAGAGTPGQSGALNAAAPSQMFHVPEGMSMPAGASPVLEGNAYGVHRTLAKTASFDKNAGLFDTIWRIGKTTTKGVGADAVSGVTGNWGLGGLMKGVGRMLGAESDTVLRKGLDNSKFLGRGAKVNGKTLNSFEEMGNYMKSQNKTMEEAARKAGRIYDDAAEAWNQTRRYLHPNEMKHLNQGFFGRMGQRFAHWGQKLTDMSDAAQAGYRKSLNANFGARTLGNQVLRKGIGFTSIAAPMGYMLASETVGGDQAWAKPGQWYGKAFEYGSIPGLLGTAASGVGTMMEDTARTATIEGARLGSQITAGELANVGRKAYLAGLIDPDKLSHMVANKANETINTHLAAQNDAIDRVSGNA